MRNYAVNVLVAFSRLANALFGGNPNKTLSHRIGREIVAGRWPDKLPWPAWLKKHFLDSA